MRSRNRNLARTALTLCALIGLAGTSASAQGSLFDRARDAALRTGLGQDLNRSAAEAQLLAGTTLDLEDSGLATLPVGALTFGVSRVDVRDGAAVRIIAFLLNPAATEVTIPAPEGDLFVLVDGRGRRLERLAGPTFEGIDGAAPAITVPALERVELSLLFAGPREDAPTATLKVGSLGMIAGIPVHTSASHPGDPSAPGSVWDAPAPGAAPTPPAEPAAPREIPGIPPPPAGT